MPALRCYVDETGLDAGAPALVVAVVCTGEDHADFEAKLLAIEIETGKRGKWKKTKEDRSLAYLARAFVVMQAMGGRAYFDVHEHGVAVMPATLATIARVTRVEAAPGQRVAVFLDGLPKHKERETRVALSALGVDVASVRGVDDERDPITRLADSVCGLMRACIEERSEPARIAERGQRLDVLRNARA